MKVDLKKLMIDEFSGENAVKLYERKVEEGLWKSENYVVSKYFTKKGKLLDLGCGTGRTTIPLSKRGFRVIGVDIASGMIESAKRIAQNKSLKIDYRIGDATALDFEDATFDYVFFPNQGWSQIPDSIEREKALREVYRILKRNGIFAFSAHTRVWFSTNILFWIRQWLRFYFLKPLGFQIPELNFGDRFFVRENQHSGKIYKTIQYVHIPKINEVVSQLQKIGFKTVEINKSLQISDKDIRKHPPVYYICQKLN